MIRDYVEELRLHDMDIDEEELGNIINVGIMFG